MSITSSWYANAVIYQVDPRLFYDSDGDGCGDLRGLTDRLDYLRGLGATALWVLPFYESPFRDGGYDVSDHLSVDPRLGDLADMARLMETADDLGIHVITELIAQHTSDQHTWFQEARSSRKSKYRDYYVWSDEPVKTGVEQVFPDAEDDVWTWDEEAQQFYRHTFYSFEPDLALDNPRVRDELERIMTFWLRLGVSGFRVDAVPFMVERARAADPTDDGLWLVRDMRDLITSQHPGAVLLGEADVEPKTYADYFRGGDGLTMLLDFWANNHIFLGLARNDARPIRYALAEQPDPPVHAQYAQWLRNNDELSLSQLTADERQEVFDAFAPQKKMQAYRRGIRRRLAPMLDGDVRRIALAHAVLLSLPGPPILRFGDEIGMGDDLDRPEREAGRTPMQWTSGPNAGFSTAEPENLVAPFVTGSYAPKNVNVYDQQVHPGSLLSKVSAMIRARLALRETGLVVPERLEARTDDGPAHQVLALRYTLGESTVTMLANLGPDDVEVTLSREGSASVSGTRPRGPDQGQGPDAEGPDGAETGRLDAIQDPPPVSGDGLVDVLADEPYDPPSGKRPKIMLRGHGYRWLRPRDRVVHRPE
ncbi:alpha-amylase family protein [Antribacter gilvus]|uniref:alpha-amylase family protein n=1 Tax=Antribacter gilvus TaxID=2304675 RepID=UPI001F0C3C3D|nr:alpha-amylase family protein [Antribacter gilvus]